MIDRLIEVSLRNRFLVVAFFLLLGGWGYWALLTTPIDAIPDLSDNQVIVFTDWPGRSPQEVEDQVTYPLTVSLQGLPGVRVVRSSSAFGFSMINVIFEDGVDLYFARSRVLERLKLLAKALPAGRRADARARRDGRRPRLLVHGRGPRPLPAGSALDPGLVHPLPAQRRARRGRGGQRRAAWCGSTRSTSIPTGSAPTASPSRPSSTPSCGATATSAATSSSRAGPGRSCAASG